MQREAAPPDNERAQEYDWELASYGRRVGAWALDFVGFALPIILSLLFNLLSSLGLFSLLVLDMFPEELALLLLTHETIGESGRVAAVIALVGYIVWWLFALGRGQTPGKWIVGIRVIMEDGSLSGWGYTFLREFVIKFVLAGILSYLTFGAARPIDYLWPLWDRKKKMQTLHDKLLGTIVVRVR